MAERVANPPASVPLAAVLELVAMQLEVALQNAAAQAESLSGSVAQFAAIGARLRAKLDASRDPELVACAAALEAEAHRAMMAMQFHDQPAQRVTHVREALGDLHDELLAGDEPAWNELVTRMRAHYTMEDERRLFELVMWAFPGASNPRTEESPSGSVELF